MHFKKSRGCRVLYHITFSSTLFCPLGILSKDSSNVIRGFVRYEYVVSWTKAHDPNYRIPPWRYYSGLGVLGTRWLSKVPSQISEGPGILKFPVQLSHIPFATHFFVKIVPIVTLFSASLFRNAIQTDSRRCARRYWVSCFVRAQELSLSQTAPHTQQRMTTRHPSCLFESKTGVPSLCFLSLQRHCQRSIRPTPTMQLTPTRS